MRKNLLKGLMLSFMLTSLMAACSEKAETVAATETADQIEEARMEGRNEAKKFITKNFTDTLQIQSALLEARSHNTKYEEEGLPKCKEAYDSAFISTIRTVRPDIANAIEKPSEE